MRFKKGMKLGFSKRHPRVVLAVVSDDELLIGHVNNNEPKTPHKRRPVSYVLRSYRQRPELKQ